MKIKTILAAMLVSISLFGAVAAPVEAVADEVSGATQEFRQNERLLDVDNNQFKQQEINAITDDGQYGEYDPSLLVASEKLSKYFVVTENGVELNADAETISKELDISQEDADLMIDASKELPLDSLSSNARGFVGVYINLGAKVRKMNGWAAGAFAAGYVGFYLKQFAVNPVTAGVVAIISAGTGASVKWAVENGIRRVSIGKNIVGFSMAFNVNVP